MQGLQGNKMSPLLGKYDLDPGQWRPLYYPTEISVGINAGENAENSVNFNHQPFIMTAISHKIVGDTADPSTSGLYQDGQYDLEWRDEQSNYQKSRCPADLMFGTWGSAANGEGGGFGWQLPYPIAFAGNRTLTFKITNRVARTLTGDPPPTTFIVAVCCIGIGDWGSLRPPMR